jgi:hypothetical protein
MISAIISVGDGKLAPTFASLAPAAVDGLVREVIVADAAASSEVAAFAEEAGARLVAAGSQSFAQACAGARHTWLLLLRSGTRLETGWGQAAWRHLSDHPDRAGWFRLGFRGGWPQAQLAEVAADLCATALGRLRAEHGLIAPRRLLDEAVARGVAPRLPFPLPRRLMRPIDARILAEL